MNLLCGLTVGIQPSTALFFQAHPLRLTTRWGRLVRHQGAIRKIFLFSPLRDHRRRETA
ncbi:hypothetical protein ES15_3304 [Cronobacter sakazakii ES15]|nr:hypothetical protein ES15_3304 [Cronobacter sakazakii ES15]